MIKIEAEFLVGHTRYYVGEIISRKRFSADELTEYQKHGWISIDGVKGKAETGKKKTIKPEDMTATTEV